ncbi:MAG TPA: ABC transporter permease [Candidatus Limnocylindria bacterium]|nr:ABC transporter permease [Candidatus Limnocylindria bacterium]
MSIVDVPLTGPAQPAGSRRGPWLLRALMAHPRGRIGLLTVVVTVAVAAALPFLVSWDVGVMDRAAMRANSHQPLPVFHSWDHPLGTDIIGRDMLARVLSAMRVSLLVALTVQVVILIIGVPIGAVAGWVGGRTETLLMRGTDVIAAFPQLVFIIMWQVAFVETPFQRLGDGLFVTLLGIGLLSWVVVARLVRAEVLSLKQRAFVEGARALGVPGRRILRRHVMPNLVGGVVVAVSAGIPAAILTESTLSFLGLGIQPPSPSLGSLIWSGSETLSRFPQLVIIPAVPLLLILVGFTMLGDGLRDVLDPRLRH